MDRILKVTISLLALAIVGLALSSNSRGSATAADVMLPAAEGASDSSLQRLQALGTLVFECFDIDKGADPQAQVLLTTKNFGTDEAIVRTAFQMCEPALKRTPPGGGGGETDIFPHVEATVAFVDPSGVQHTVMLEGMGAWHVMIGPRGETAPALGGPDTVPVELLALSLHSAQPVMFMGSFFDVFVDIRGDGMLMEHANQMPGKLEVPPFASGYASASLNISMDVMIMPRAAHLLSAAPMDIHVMAEAQLEGDLTHKPPAASDTLTLVKPVDLVDSAGNPAGRLTGVSLLLNPGGPNPATSRVLECYKLDKGADPNDAVRLTTKNFGPDDVVVRLSTVMCEGAIKSAQASTAAPPNVIWQCYDIQEGLNPKASFTLTTRNFGEHAVDVHRAFLMCEEARKIGITTAGVTTVVGQPTGRTFECFLIRGKIERRPFVLTTRNFGPDDVFVDNPRMMCEPAPKVRLPTTPRRTPTPTPATAPTPTPTPAGTGGQRLPIPDAGDSRLL